MKQTVLALALLSVVMVAIVDCVEAQSSGPTFTVENPRINVGEIKAGSDAVATFVFHNEGPADVKIIKAKPS
jgi:hypothetical protein